MLSVNYIYNCLNNKQTKINIIYYDKINEFEKNKDISKNNEWNNSLNENNTNKLDKYQFNLPNSFDIIFNKSIKNFYYDSKIYKNKSPIFTLLHSLLLIGNRFFNLSNENEKEIIIKQFILKIDNDLFQKDLYNKFNYTKNRTFNKSDIQMVIKNAFQFKHCDKINLLKEYLADYLGVNIYIFNINNGNIDFLHLESYMTKYYGNNINKYLPHFLLIKENEIYKPIMINNNNDTSLFKYDEHSELIENIWKYFKLNDNLEKEVVQNKSTENKNEIVWLKNLDNEVQTSDTEVQNKDNEVQNSDTEVQNKDNEVQNKDTETINIKISENKKYNISNLKNIKIDDIKKMCEDENIETKKKSDKTSKMINKLKNELIDDLLKI